MNEIITAFLQALIISGVFTVIVFVLIGALKFWNRG